MVTNISLYRIFCEVARRGSISAAARHLYVTQPAVSVGIMQLENELGVKLFFRNSKGIRLTQEGETLYGYVSTALGYLESGEDKLRDMNNLDGGVLRIGASDMTLKFYLLDYLESFNRNYPKVRLTVSNNPTPKCIEELKNGAIDFCVVTEPITNDPEIEYRSVKEVRDIAVCAADAYTDLPEENIGFTEILAHTTVMLDKQTSTRRAQEDWMRKCGAPEELLQPEIELATSELVLEFAKRGIGIACIVEDFAKADILSGKLRELPLAQPFPKRAFLLAHLKKLPLSAAAAHFVSLLD